MTRKTWPETDAERSLFADWQSSVSNGDTVLGFRDWVANEAEMEALSAALDDPEDPAVDSTGERVMAHFTTDDGEYEFAFDATEFFAGASDAALVELRDIGWGGDYAADEVAYAVEAANPTVALALVHANERKVGFEVRVDVSQGAVWLAKHRPHLVGVESEDGETV